MKKVFSLVVMALALGFAGSASAGWGSSSNPSTTRVEIPGGYTLDQAHAVCQTKLKTGGYQECMAGKRGLFSVDADGNPHENFVRTEKQAVPTSPASCVAEMVTVGNQISWKITRGCSQN